MPKKACAVTIDERDERLAALAQREQREAEQDRQEQHLQDLAFGERADHGVGNDIQEVVDGAMLLGLGRRRRTTALVLSVARSTFMPAPGRQTLR